MIRLAAVLALLCGPAWSQQTVQAGGDVIELRASERNFAEVFYSNSPAQTSKVGVYELEYDGVTITVIIQFGTGNTERVIVRPQDTNYVAIPEMADVEDGESVVIQIMQPMF